MTEPHEFVGRLDRWCEVCLYGHGDSFSTEIIFTAIAAYPQEPTDG